MGKIWTQYSKVERLCNTWIYFEMHNNVNIVPVSDSLKLLHEQEGNNPVVEYYLQYSNMKNLIFILAL